ncbi:MAG TPA: DUF433 domain-containing protein [Roseiarcus sp.]|jgi:uncharacterized protein (DUF433 family)|nr:DUF433 domain-containing protein [Roseiarcus sp.]
MTGEIISAFTEEQAESLTGVSVHRLRRWDRTSFFQPSLAGDNRRLPYSRIYSFRDLLSLQVLRSLRDDAGCSLQHLREVRDKLTHLGDDMWSRTKLYVFNKKVVFYDEQKEELREPVSGQLVLQIPLHAVLTGMKTSVGAMSKRQPEEFGRIERNRNVSHNAPVIAGTRITVGAVKRLSEDGYSTEKILAEFPSLTAADVAAALKYHNGKRAA